MPRYLFFYLCCSRCELEPQWVMGSAPFLLLLLLPGYGNSGELPMGLKATGPLFCSLLLPSTLTEQGRLPGTHSGPDSSTVVSHWITRDSPTLPPSC